jgi:hypothetical protein
MDSFIMNVHLCNGFETILSNIDEWIGYGVIIVDEGVTIKGHRWDNNNRVLKGKV